MSNIEALYLVSGFWLAALPLSARIRSLEKLHATKMRALEIKANSLIAEAKLEAGKKDNEN